MTRSGLKDVAHAAGVSYKTVSRVVNGERSVSAETRQRVEAAIAATGYRPNQSARNLRRGRTQTLRLIMYLREARLHNERFQDEVIAALIDRATASGYSVLMELSRESDSPMQITRFSDLRSDGTVLLDGRLESPVAQALLDAGSPTVLLVNPDCAGQLGSVDADFEGGAFTMVRTLIELGHRRIAHLRDDLRLHSSRKRLEGYRRALGESDISFDDELIIATGYMRHHGYSATRQLLERSPDVSAIFCVNDLTALGAIECATRLGLRVPGDLSITGYDDIAVAQYSTPSLTTLHIPWYEMAVEAVEQLIGVIERGDGWAQKQFPVEMCLRESIGPATA